MWLNRNKCSSQREESLKLFELTFNLQHRHVANGVSKQRLMMKIFYGGCEHYLVYYPQGLKLTELLNDHGAV